MDGGRWTNRQKNPAFWLGCSGEELSGLFFKHPGRHLMEPFSVSRSLVSFFVVGWIVDGDTTRR